MADTIILVFFSLIGLITLHELGHYILARLFGVKVEEFGIFMPPRLYGKQIGETIYSINLLPLGAFVKLQGEEGKVEGIRSFTGKPIWQRALIVAGGVISFWIIAVIILIYVFATGATQVVSDSDSVPSPAVRIVSVFQNSPASASGIAAGDVIKKITLKSDPSITVNVDKVTQVQDFTNNHKGKEVNIEVQRGGETLDLTLTPRENPPVGEGSMGISLVRTGQVTYGWRQAVGKGFSATWGMTVGVFTGWGQIIGRLVSHQGLPPGTAFVGPIGIGVILNQAAQMGLNYYLQFIAMISVYLAIFNALPIPALDGGKLLFLAIETTRKKPVSEKIEQAITAAFFFVLIALSILVTFGDISRLF